MLTVVLTRHGHTDLSDTETYLGQRVVAPLSERGRRDALALRERLATVRFARVLTSPLPRAVETTELVVPGFPVERDDRLMEMDYGAWDGLTPSEIEARFPEARVRYDEDPAGFRLPDGESGADVAARVESLLKEMIGWANAPERANSEPLVLLVGHSSLNRVLLAVALGVPLRDYRRRFLQGWLNLTVLRFAGAFEAGAKLIVANDMAHVRGTRGATWD